MNNIQIILFLFLLFNLPNYSIAQSVRAHSKNENQSVKQQTITYRLIEAKYHTYGYNIFINDSLFIHQPVIPCIAGNKGFKTKADAKKIAVLVIKKIRNQIIPPSVSVTEMKTLGVKF